MLNTFLCTVHSSHCLDPVLSPSIHIPQLQAPKVIRGNENRYTNKRGANNNARLIVSFSCFPNIFRENLYMVVTSTQRSCAGPFAGCGPKLATSSFRIRAGPEMYFIFANRPGGLNPELSFCFNTITLTMSSHHQHSVSFAVVCC